MTVDWFLTLYISGLVLVIILFWITESSVFFKKNPKKDSKWKKSKKRTYRGYDYYR